MDGPQAPPGWYPDPEDPRAERRWDGARWTDHRRPRPAADAGPPTEPLSTPGAGPEPAAAAAGWYDDPEVPGGERWWTGTGWGEARRGVDTEARVPFYKSAWFFVVAGLVVLIGIVAALGGSPESGDDDAVPLATTTTATEATSNAGQTTTTVDSTTSPDDPTTSRAETTTTQAETTTTTEPTTTTALETTTTEPAWEAFTVEGQGDDIVDFAIPGGEPAALQLRHSGTSNFAVLSADADGEHLDLLVNTIGSYEGTRPVNFLDDEIVAELEVTADGPWEITAVPLPDLPEMADAFEGMGDQVIAYVGTGNRLTVAHDGESNFAILAWSEDGRDLLVNEIGPYEGTVRIDPAARWIEITADGTWTLSTGS